MQNHCLETDAGDAFLLLHGAPEQIKAVRLGGRAGAFVDADHQPLFTFRDGRHGLKCGVIIGINADEDPVIAFAPSVDRIAQHRSDHVCFTPSRYEYGNPPRSFRGGQGGSRHARMSGVNGDPAPPAAAEKHDIDQEVVNATYGEADHREQQYFMMNSRQNGGHSRCHNLVPPERPSQWQRKFKNQLPSTGWEPMEALSMGVAAMFLAGRSASLRNLGAHRLGIAKARSEDTWTQIYGMARSAGSA